MHEGEDSTSTLRRLLNVAKFAVLLFGVFALDALGPVGTGEIVVPLNMLLELLCYLLDARARSRDSPAEPLLDSVVPEKPEKPTKPTKPTDPTKCEKCAKEKERAD